MIRRLHCTVAFERYHLIDGQRLPFVVAHAPVRIDTAHSMKQFAIFASLDALLIELVKVGAELQPKAVLGGESFQDSDIDQILGTRVDCVV